MDLTIGHKAEGLTTEKHGESQKIKPREQSIDGVHPYPLAIQ